LNRLFQSVSIAVIIITIIKIIFLLHYWIIPAVFFLIGLGTALYHQKYSLFVFMFLFPFINSSPGLFRSDFPFNYIAPALFLLSGMVIPLIVKQMRAPKIIDSESHSRLDQGFFSYYLFLIILIFSTLFVFIRWGNIGLSGISIAGADTPVAPETPFSSASAEPQRFSLASIFPIVSLFIYFISPYIYFYIKKLKPREKVIFQWLSFGFYISVGMAFVQKISGHSLISDRLGKELKQFYGGFSDFNAFGFFSGVMFLWSTYEIKNKNPLGYITFLVSLAGAFLSGSRTTFIFILAGIANIIYMALRGRKKQQKIAAIVLVIFVLILIISVGGTLTKRLSEGFSEDESLFKKINAITNGRLWMTLFSLQTIRDYFVPGVGTGNFTFYLAYKNYIPFKQSGEKYLYDLPLNHYLLIFTENGSLGFLFFTLAMLFFFFRSNKKLLIGAILVALLLNNYFWFPENFLLFWILAALTDSGKRAILGRDILYPKNKKIIAIVVFTLFIAANIISFHSLHPLTWARKAGYDYDYGFWYWEKDEQGNEFRWSKEYAGIYLDLDEKGFSPEIKIFCGAPLNNLAQKQQKVEIYWQGKLYREIAFKENRTEFIKIKGEPEGKGFLEIKANPVFNLKKLGLGAETRNLGVQFFLN